MRCWPIRMRLFIQNYLQVDIKAQLAVALLITADLRANAVHHAVAVLLLELLTDLLYQVVNYLFQCGILLNHPSQDITGV